MEANELKEYKKEKDKFVSQFKNKIFNAVPANRHGEFAQGMERARLLGGYLYDDALEDFIRKIHFNKEKSVIEISFESNRGPGILMVRIPNTKKKHIKVSNYSNHSIHLMKPNSHRSIANVKKALIDIIYCFCLTDDEIIDDLTDENEEFDERLEFHLVRKTDKK